MRIQIPIEPGEKELGKFRIEDSGLLTFEYFFRWIALVWVPFAILLMILGYFMESGQPISQRLYFGFMMTMGFTIFIFLLLILPGILFFWFHYWRKSYVLLTDRSMKIHLPALKNEWIENRIMMENIRSVRMLTDEEKKAISQNSLLHRFKIFPRPKHLVNGFYHNISKPDGLIRIDLYQQTPVYNFFKHSMESRQSGPPSVPRLIMEDNSLICDASDRYFGSVYYKGRARQDNGPAIRGYIVESFYIAIRKKDRKRFLDLLSELTRNNTPPQIDITMELMISQLQMSNWITV